MNQKENNALPMKVDCTVHPVSDMKNLKAFVSVCFNDCFVVNGLKVMDGQKGLFVSMPSAKNRQGEYKDTCFPITADFRSQLSKTVLDSYHKTMEKAQEKSSVRGDLNQAAKESRSTPAKPAPGKDKGAR